MSEVVVALTAFLSPLAAIAAVVGIVIYLIIQRLREKENETFEDRNN